MGAGRVGTVLGVAAVALAVVLGTGADTATAPVPAPAAVTTAPVLRIMPLGSSSTVGQGSPATAGFRGPLEDLLTRDGIAFDMVGSQRSGPPSLRDRDNEGYGGATIARLQPSVAGWVRAQRPDVVLLQVGTNDLITGVAPAVVAQRLDTMLTTIRATVPRAHVAVAGVWAPLRSRLAARTEYARLAAAVVARHRAAGGSTTYLDTATLLGPGDIADGLHPDADGYRKIAALWEREIRSWVGGRRH